MRRGILEVRPLSQLLFLKGEAVEGELMASRLIRPRRSSLGVVGEGGQTLRCCPGFFLAEDLRPFPAPVGSERVGYLWVKARQRRLFGLL